MQHTSRLLPAIAGTYFAVSPPAPQPFGRWAGLQHAPPASVSGVEEIATIEVGPLKVSGRGENTAPLVAIGGIALAAFGLGWLLGGKPASK